MNSQSLKSYIKSKRDNLSVSSVNTYASVLRGMGKQFYGSPDITEEQLNDYSSVLGNLKDLPIPRKKTILSALVITTTGKPQEEYRKEMVDSLDKYRDEMSNNEMTEKQRENWVTKEELMAKEKEMEKKAKLVMKKYRESGSVDAKDVQYYQDFLLLVLTSGLYFPPRRSLDWLAFKVRNIDKDTDNYLDKDSIVFNKYKTAKSYGQQRIKVGRHVANLIKNYAKILPENLEYLLNDAKGTPFYRRDEASGSVKVNQRLNKLFKDKKVGVNTMRHTNVTEKFGQYIEQRKQIDKKIEKEMKKMGSSSAMVDTYAKIK